VRNREEFGAGWEDMPVFGTSAATFNDDGVTALYQELGRLLSENGLTLHDGRLPRVSGKTSTAYAAVIPPERVRYLSEIAETVRKYHADTESEATRARVRQHLRTARELVGEAVEDALHKAEQDLAGSSAELLDTWPQVVEDYSGDELVVQVRDSELRTRLTRETLSGNKIPRPEFSKRDDIIELADKTIPPEWNLHAHWAVNGFTFLTSDYFPKHKGDIFFASHGSWNSITPVGALVGRVLFDPNTVREDATVALSDFTPSPKGDVVAYAIVNIRLAVRSDDDIGIG